MRVLRSKASVRSFFLQGVFLQNKHTCRHKHNAQVFFSPSVSCFHLSGVLSLSRSVICELDEAKILSYILPSVGGAVQCVRVLADSGVLTRTDKCEIFIFTPPTMQPSLRSYVYVLYWDPFLCHSAHQQKYTMIRITCTSLLMLSGSHEQQSSYSAHFFLDSCGGIDPSWQPSC